MKSHLRSSGGGLRGLIVVGVMLTAMACSSESKSPPGEREVTAAVERCIGAVGGEDAERFVGMSEAKLRTEADGEHLIVRVLGRDEECFGRTDDLRPNRVNVLLIDGWVVWARRF